ncbi:MAG: hypothetical protein MUF45_07160 [Spirosomaceae bacterium]|jgi:hypothetical protein|nr:hypothetical protein [Spirosomataceae bacterium]
MKKTLLFIATLIALSTSAQKTNSVRFNGGHAFFGTGDLKGIYFSTEYQKQLTKLFSVGAEFGVSSATSQYNYVVNKEKEILYFSTQNAYKINLNGFLNLINTEKHLAQIGSGLSGRIGYRYSTGGFTTTVDKNGKIIYLLDNGNYRKGNQIGLIVNLSYAYKISSGWSLFGRGALQIYETNLDNLIGGGIGYSF